MIKQDYSTYLCLMHTKKFDKQPKGREMAFITNDLKRQTSQSATLPSIIERFANGYCGILAHVNKEMQFVSSNLFAVDIDDNEKQTNPQEVFATSGACGLFFTFSHGIKGNRYRLIFQLDTHITDKDTLQEIAQIKIEELLAKNVPADNLASNPTQIIRGGKHGTSLVDERKCLDSTKYIAKVKQRARERQERLMNQITNKDYKPLTYEQLKIVVEVIGYLPSGESAEVSQAWQTIVHAIKLHERQGFITEQEGLELFHIVSGNEQSDKAYYRLNPSGKATIASIIYYARKFRNFEATWLGFTTQEHRPDPKETEYRKVSRYISTSEAKELIQRREKLLVDSPTGSGKTRSFITACKESEKANNHVYIFSAPTVALTKQIASAYGVHGVHGEQERLFKQVSSNIKNGKRVFVATYDMTSRLINYLRKYHFNDLNYTLIVDEFHKLVLDYNYRDTSIKSLYQAITEARSFIALSGTTNEIIQSDFDKTVIIDNGQRKAQVTDLAVYTYEKRKQSKAELIKLIETIATHETNNKKLIVFIQSKEVIKEVKEALTKSGIKTRTVTADDKRNATYKSITEREAIEDDIQVILTTSVIADGVNILNQNSRFEVLAVCSHFSELFNPSTVKQISNRLRAHYDRFSLFIMETVEEQDTKQFDLNKLYYAKEKIAKALCQEANNDQYFSASLFLQSVIENRYGMYIDHNDTLQYDKLFLRHSCVAEQSRYYASRRKAFIAAVQNILGVPSEKVKYLNVSQELRSKNIDISYIESFLEQKAEEKRQEEQEKNENTKSAFTREVYKAFQKDDTDKLEAFKESVPRRVYSHLRHTTQILPYETCYALTKTVKRDCDTHAFIRDIERLGDLYYMFSVNRRNFTKDMIQGVRGCLELTERQTKADYDERLQEIAKRLKYRGKNDTKEVEPFFIAEVYRSKKVYYKWLRANENGNAQLITSDILAERYGITTKDINTALLEYAKRYKPNAYKRVIESRLNNKTTQDKSTLL